MKVVVIGLGSMGKRRIRLLQKRDDIDEIIGIDSRDDRRMEAANHYSIEVFSSTDELAKRLWQNVCAFVCTSPLSHASVIQECLKLDWHVFTEINLLKDGYHSNLSLAKERNKVLFLSSTPKYREEIKFITSKVLSSGSPINYVYHVGQYLPDWHPWENVNSFFVSDIRTNGCREIMGVELPWMLDAFGEIENIHILHDKMCNLALDFDDNYYIQIEHCNGNKGIFIVDVVCRMAVRSLEVYNEQLYLKWDGRPSGLEVYDIEDKEMKHIELYQAVEHQAGYQETIIEDAYAAEIEEFLNCIKGKAKQRHTFEMDESIIDWIDRIEGIS